MNAIRNALVLTVCASPVIYPFISTTKIIEEFGSNHRHLTIDQRKLIAGTIQSYPQCRLLIIGTGIDSGLWRYINKRGTTLFLEHDDFWIAESQKHVPGIQIFKIEYETQLPDWQALLNVPHYTNFLPTHAAKLLSSSWDVILIDGPPSHPVMPECQPPVGRMQAFFLAHTFFFNAKETVHLFIHDTDRPAEKAYAEKLFGDTYLMEEQENLLYYRITP